MATQEELTQQSEAVSAFATWITEHPGLTKADLTDIATQVKDLRDGKTTDQLSPKTTLGGNFKSWVISAPKNAQALIQDPNNWLTRLSELPDPPDDKIIAKVKVVAETIKIAEQKITAAPTYPSVAASLIITRTPYPKWWKRLQTAAISLSTAGTQVVVATPGRFTLFIATIVLVVSDETNISFGFGVFGSSGPMYLGGGVQPSGMVIAMGDSPAPCGVSGFTITSDGNGVTVGGFVTYYLESET